MKTMPHRETVAGLATLRSSTSNIMCSEGASLIRSELARQSVLLSSSTVFMFSIQAVDGPSKTAHLRRPSSTSRHACRTILGTSPSLHSPVRSLNWP